MSNQYSYYYLSNYYLPLLILLIVHKFDVINLKRLDIKLIILRSF